MTKDFPELTEGLFYFLFSAPLLILIFLLLASLGQKIMRAMAHWGRTLLGMAEAPAPLPIRWHKRLLGLLRKVAIYSFACFVVWTPTFLVPEYYGRKAASDFCATMVEGRVIDINDINMQSASSRDYIRRIREEHSSMMFGIDFYPKEEGVPGSRDTAIFFFAAGFPFSRAACLIALENGVVKSREVRFNAEDMMYCNGKLQHMVHCAGETTSGHP